MLPFILALAVLTTASDVNRYIASRQTNDVTFVLSGHVVSCSQQTLELARDFTIEDESGITRLRTTCEGCPAPGDTVVVRGHSVTDYTRAKTFVATDWDVTGRKPIPPPVDFEIGKADPAALDFRSVRTHGTVIDAFHDEISPYNDFLILRANDALMSVSVPPDERIADYIGCDVRVTGFFKANLTGRRIIGGAYVSINAPEDLELLKRPAADRFEVPELGYLLHVDPAEVVRMGPHRIAGSVAAIWGGGRCLIRTADGRVIQVTLSSIAARPSAGDDVQAVGFPDTDLFGVNLVNAAIRPWTGGHVPEPEAVSIPARELFHDADGRPRISIESRGRLFRVTGIVRDLPPANGRFNLQCGEFTLPIDISANPTTLDRLMSGMEIEVTGVCLIETDSWRPNVIVPHINGIALVLRSPDDIRVLSNPPWWTPTRLLIAIGILILTLIGFFIRLRIQKRIAALRFSERTRLAVELHDSLSQNLEGLACQIAATKGVFEADRSLAARCLDTAEHMLDSCRIELRRCLFDLRGTALEEANLSDAIRKTLEPILPDTVQTAIRFNVSRAHFDDSTVHAILCIIRELVSNALRHGQATHIRIAGEYHDGTLSFSVRDNGCGFNPAACAGPGEGHFGLTGIRERIDHLGGTFAITSTPGRGTRVKATIAPDPSAVPHRTENRS